MAVDALDLIGPPATAQDMNKAMAMIEMNYGVPAQDEKVLMLFEMIKEEGWSAERLKQTVRWFLKNKKFPNWTIADWFEYGVKMYPYSWYLEQISKGANSNDLECYKVNGRILWKIKDGTELPFERVQQ